MHFNKVLFLIFISFLSCVDLSAQFKIKGIGVEYSGSIRNTFLEQSPVYYRNTSDESMSLSLFFNINKYEFQIYGGFTSNRLDHYVDSIRDITRITRLQRENIPAYELFGINFIRNISDIDKFDIDLLTGFGLIKLGSAARPRINATVSNSSSFNTTADAYLTSSDIELGLNWLPFFKTRVEFIAKPLNFIELVSFIEYNYAFGLNLLEGTISTYRLSESWADRDDGIPNTTYLDDRVYTQKLDVSASNLGFGVMTRVKF